MQSKYICADVIPPNHTIYDLKHTPDNTLFGYSKQTPSYMCSENITLQDIITSERGWWLLFSFIYVIATYLALVFRFLHSRMVPMVTFIELK